ncbi:hypothetical protein AX17_002182 [Amanita inopinata Kibby_2008]|nr:hypothetical protein AX17_002182 [Amanita inopinata Kibby_2008]
MWKLIAKPFTPYTRRKTWRRFLGDVAFRYLSNMDVKKVLYAMGTTRWVYTTWARWYKLPVTMTDVGEDARLLWIGPKRTARVVLYLHGGGYVAPLQHFTVTFWRYVQQELDKRGIEIGIAILNYSLVTSKPFPTQLRQAVSALEYLTSVANVPTHKIQIAGDSAGGSLALALVSHMLHPLDDIPRLSISQPFRGMFLMSPWVSLTGDTGSHFTNNETDITSQHLLQTLGAMALTGVQEHQIPYIQAASAQEGWFKGATSCVDRFLITTGDKECLHDDVVVFAKAFCKENGPAVTFVEQPDGVHNDPFYDFMVSEPKLGVLTPLIVDWLVEGFT